MHSALCELQLHFYLPNWSNLCSCFAAQRPACLTCSHERGGAEDRPPRNAGSAGHPGIRESWPALGDLFCPRFTGAPHQRLPAASVPDMLTTPPGRRAPCTIVRKYAAERARSRVSGGASTPMSPQSTLADSVCMLACAVQSAPPHVGCVSVRCITQDPSPALRSTQHRRHRHPRCLLEAHHSGDLLASSFVHLQHPNPFAHTFQ